MHGPQNIKSPDIYVNILNGTKTQIQSEYLGHLCQHTKWYQNTDSKRVPPVQSTLVPLSTVFEATDMNAHHLRMMHQVH